MSAWRRRALPERRCPSTHPLDPSIRCTLPWAGMGTARTHVELFDDPQEVHAAFDRTGRFVYHQWLDGSVQTGDPRIVVGNPRRYRQILVHPDGTTWSSEGDVWERWPRRIRYSSFWWQDFWRYTIRRKLRWT